MNKRQKKKLIKRSNHWHYKGFRKLSEEVLFFNNTPYTADIMYRSWNRKHTKIRKVLLFTNCYPSAVVTNGENTTTFTDDYIIHVDLSKYGDIVVEQNVRMDVDEQ